MAYTNKELASEFWMLTKGMLQDCTIDTEEAVVLKRWLEEHGLESMFAPLVEQLTRFLADGFIDRFESNRLIDSFGTVLSRLRRAEA